jgi:hypothetical protein
MLSVGLGRFDSRVGVRKHSKTSPRGEAVSYIKRLSTQMGGVVNENTHHRYTARDCRRLRQREAPWPGCCQSMSDMAGPARPEFLRQPAPRPFPGLPVLSATSCLPTHPLWPSSHSTEKATAERLADTSTNGGSRGLALAPTLRDKNKAGVSRKGSAKLYRLFECSTPGFHLDKEGRQCHMSSMR